MSKPQPTDRWSICLTSDRMAYVEGHIYRLRTADALVRALRVIEPLLPRAAELELDGDWAE